MLFLVVPGHGVLEFSVEPSDTVVEAGQSAVLDCVVRASHHQQSVLITWLDEDGSKLTFLSDAYRYCHIFAPAFVLFRNKWWCQSGEEKDETKIDETRYGFLAPWGNVVSLLSDCISVPISMWTRVTFGTYVPSSIWNGLKLG